MLCKAGHKVRIVFTGLAAQLVIHMQYAKVVEVARRPQVGRQIG